MVEHVSNVLFWFEVMKKGPDKLPPVGFKKGLNASEDEKFLKMGLMKKSTLGRWDPRFFILEGRVLKWFKSPSDKEEKGRLVLDDVIRITPELSGVNPPRRELKSCLMGIEANVADSDRPRLFVLCASSETDARTFVHALFHNLRLLCGRTDSVINPSSSPRPTRASNADKNDNKTIPHSPAMGEKRETQKPSAQVVQAQRLWHVGPEASEEQIRAALEGKPIEEDLQAPKDEFNYENFGESGVYETEWM